MPGEPMPVMDRVAVTYSGLRYDRRGAVYTTQAVIENVSNVSVRAPMRLVVRPTSGDFEVMGASGVTPDGDGFIEVPLNDGRLLPGERAGPVPVVMKPASRRTRIRFVGIVEGVRFLAGTPGFNPFALPDGEPTNDVVVSVKTTSTQ